VTNDGELLVLSDGSDVLTWVDPAAGFSKVRSVEVKMGDRPVTNLNEVRGWDFWYGGGCAVLCCAVLCADSLLLQSLARPHRASTQHHLTTHTPHDPPPTKTPQLEMVDGEVWANVWYTPCIARVCPATGQVTGWLLMHGLRESLLRRNLPMQGKRMDVLNGASRVEGWGVVVQARRGHGVAFLFCGCRVWWVGD